MKRPALLLLFLGVTGSGKSFFARQLAEKLGAVRFNGDAMRIALFGTQEAVEARYKDPTTNKMTFGAITYAASQVLRAGRDVVHDANNNKRRIRQELAAMASEHNALTIIVKMETPIDMARERSLGREKQVDQPVFNADVVDEITRRNMRDLDEPDEGERVITIDGTVNFEMQLSSFERQLEAILRLQPGSDNG